MTTWEPWEVLEPLLLCRPGCPPGIVVSSHQDNTGQCHEGGSCMGGWAGGYVPKGSETAGQLGGLGRHSLSPATPWASEPCHHQHALQNVTAQGFHVTVLGSDCVAGLREDLGEHYPGSGWDAQGRVCPLPSFLPSTGLCLPLSFFPFIFNMFGSQCSGCCGEKCSSASTALRLGTEEAEVRTAKEESEVMVWRRGGLPGGGGAGGLECGMARVGRVEP